MTRTRTKKLLIATGIYYPEIGGPATYARVLSQRLAEDYQVTLLTYSPVSNAAADRALPYRVIRVSKKIPWLIRHLIFFVKVLTAAKNAQTVFALNAVSAGLPAALAAKFLKKKFFLRVVGDYAWEIAAGRGRTSVLLDDFQKSPKRGWIWVLNMLQLWVAKGARLVIVPSSYLAGVVGGWGVESGKIQVVPNGVDFVASSLTPETARVKIGVAGTIILSAGRLVPWKGFKMLVKIMPRLLEINQFFRLVIIGDGPERKTLEAMIRNLGLQNKVFLVGRRTPQELAIYLAAAELFVLNTGYEGFSHQILEAMAAGVPVVTTTSGGNPEMIKQGQNGFMVNYNDEFNLIEAIKTVYLTPTLQERFVEEGLKTAKHFNVEQMLEGTSKILVN